MLKTIFEFIKPLELKGLIDSQNIKELEKLVDTIKDKRSKEIGKYYNKYSKVILELNKIIKELKRREALNFLISANQNYRMY